MKPETKRLLAVAGKNATLILLTEAVFSLSPVAFKGANISANDVAIMGGVGAAYLVMLYGLLYVVSQGKNPFKTVAGMFDLIREVKANNKQK